MAAAAAAALGPRFTHLVDRRDELPPTNRSHDGPGRTTAHFRHSFAAQTDQLMDSRRRGPKVKLKVQQGHEFDVGKRRVVLGSTRSAGLGTNGATMAEEAEEAEEEGDEIVGSSDFRTSFARQWRGGEKSLTKAGERLGSWNTAGLEGPARFVVEGDHKSASWSSKLDVVRALLTGEFGETERLDSLVCSAIYLKWINTGQIPCREGGERPLPSSLAKISQYIFRELERFISARRVSSQETLVLKKIHTCLLSFKAEFTDPGPLIRSNGVPNDLKRLSTIDKLHRSTGPEDLVAIEAVLVRLTKYSGQCTEDVVEHLKIFHTELKRFFNADSLADKLEELRDSLEKQKLPLLHRVQTYIRLDYAKARSGGHAETSESLIETLNYATDLRALLTHGLESGIRNDAPDVAIAMRQKWRLSEIGLENYASSLLGRYVAALESTGGSDFLARQVNSSDMSSWRQPLLALALGLRQLRLSGWLPNECLKIETDLSVWQSAVTVQPESSEEDRRLAARRLAALLAQSRHLAHTYTDTVLQLYEKPVERLRRAMGICEDSLLNFAEAESQSSVAFQLLRLLCIQIKGNCEFVCVSHEETTLS